MRRSILKSKSLLLLAVTAGSGLHAHQAFAVDGSYVGPTGNYTDSTKWTNGIIADGVDAVATVNVGATATTALTLTVNAPITIGTLKVTDTTNSNKDFILTGSGSLFSNPVTPTVITLATTTGTPTLDFTGLNSGKTISNSGAHVLAGNQGVIFDIGTGKTFSLLTNMWRYSTLTGTVTIASGLYGTSFISTYGLPANNRIVLGNGTSTAAIAIGANSQLISGFDSAANTYLYNSGSGITNGQQTVFSLTVGNNDQSGIANGVIGKAQSDTATQFHSALAITKIGTGTQVFNGPSYVSGTTTVSAGTLVINGTHTATPNVGFNTYAAATTGTAGQYAVSGTLAGNGTISPFDTVGAATPMIDVLAGGTLAPGYNGVGTLTLDSSRTVAPLLTLESGATLGYDIGATADLLAIAAAAAGDVKFNNNVLNISTLGTFSPGSFTLMSSAAASTYAGLTVDSFGTITAGLTLSPAFLAAYPASTLSLSGGNIVLNASVPEPTGVAVALVGLGLLARRRRA